MSVLSLAPGTAGSTQQNDPGSYTGVLLMFTWMIVALVLYYMRPAALRRGENGKGSNDRDVSGLITQSVDVLYLETAGVFR